MPDPELLIWALTAVAVVLLFPVRMWLRRRRRRDEDEEQD